jgi:hypothetical protein
MTLLEVLYCRRKDRLAVCLEEGVPIISFFWGQAGPLIEIAHRGGAKALHTSDSPPAPYFVISMM